MGNISVHIGAPELCDLALKAVKPGWNKHAKVGGVSYHLTLANIILRNKDGVRLIATHDAIAAQFFKPKAGGGQTVFKTGQAVVWLEVMEEHYDAFVEWCDKQEEEALRRELKVRDRSNFVSMLLSMLCLGENTSTPRCRSL